MKTFLEKHGNIVSGVLSCYDRLILKGYLNFTYPKSMEGWLSQQGILLKDFRGFALKQSAKIKDFAHKLAEKEGRPFIALQKKIRKEERAKQIAQSDGITQGLICVFSVQEGCASFQIAYGKGRPRLKRSYPRIAVLYFYYLDPECGLIHVRIPTWFPFSIQVYVNGHEWLARQLDRAGIGYKKRDNAFLAIDDFPKAQALADQLERVKWPRLLNALARRVNPLMKDVLKGCRYRWYTDQAEMATDVVFQDVASLSPLYCKLLEHALLKLSAEDVLSFMGKKCDGRFRGEVTTDLKKTDKGFRVKHAYDGNWLKMYDKFGVILRIEMVINRPRRFRIRRWGTRNGERVFAWFSLLKNVRFLGRYADLSRQATYRYIDALAVVADPRVSGQILDRACNPVPYKDTRRRALNPLGREDQKLFFAVLRGEHAIRGFYAKDVAKHLNFEQTNDPRAKRRQSGRVGRLLQLLRAHGLIRKLPNTRRYRATEKGFAFMSAAIQLRHKMFHADMADAA